VPAGIGRLELFIVLRAQLADRALVRRALAVEAVMEELARAAGADVALWGLAGLGCDIDVTLTAHNLERRGAVAEELLRAEGVPAEAAAAARLMRAPDVDTLPPLARALVVARLLVELAARELSEPGTRLDDLADGRLAHRWRRLAKRDDPEALRALAAVHPLTPERAAEAALAGHLRVREDLNL
jgi:predicted hydrolase (HD superfamily)